MLFIILFLHQTTTQKRYRIQNTGCLSSCSYIKPQQYRRDTEYRIVVYHLVPTSNHNHEAVCSFFLWLFIILFLHQTTTVLSELSIFRGCLSSCSYIKPQQRKRAFIKFIRCLSSCSYIKPQPRFSTIFRAACCLSSCSYIKPQHI